jgi:hypothetical protein
MKVRVVLEVTVIDPAALLTYAEAQKEAWGLTGFSGLPEMVSEALVNNNPGLCPLDVGCEIASLTAVAL